MSGETAQRRVLSVAFARQMIAVGLRKYGDDPAHRISAAKLILLHAARLARPFLGDAAVRGLVEQALSERPLSALEPVE